MIVIFGIFSFLLVVVTLYLALLQYTKFFKHTSLSTMFILNLNFYLLLLYLLCFLLSVFCTLAEYSIKLAAEVMAHKIIDEIPIESQSLDLPTKSMFAEGKK